MDEPGDPQGTEFHDISGDAAAPEADASVVGGVSQGMAVAAEVADAEMVPDAEAVPEPVVDESAGDREAFIRDRI